MKALIVPIDKEAQARFVEGNPIEFDLISVFFNEEDYKELLGTPAYTAIHGAYNQFLSSEHNSAVTDNHALSSFRTLLKQYEPPMTNPLICTLKYMIDIAIRFGTGVYWVVM